MIYCIQRPIRLTSMAAVAATLAVAPAAAQDTGGACTFSHGPIKAEQVTNCLGELEATVAALKARVDELQQPTIDPGPNREFNNNYKTESDGLVIAFFTSRPGSMGEGRIQASLEGLVDTDADGLNPKDTRATDSFLANSSSMDRSATIVMPVKAGEGYRVNLSVFDGADNELSRDERNDEERFVSQIHFVRF